MPEQMRIITHYSQKTAVTVSSSVVSRMLWKFPGGALRAFEGSVFQAARSRGIGSMG